VGFKKRRHSAKKKREEIRSTPREGTLLLGKDAQASWATGRRTPFNSSGGDKRICRQSITEKEDEWVKENIAIERSAELSKT